MSNSIILTFTLFLAIPALVAGANECSLFSINGSRTTHFEYYRFYDFRNITNGSSNTTNSSSSFPKSKSVSDGSYLDDWTVRVQDRAASNDHTIGLRYTADNVFVANTTNPTGSYLALDTQRHSELFQLAGEFDYTAVNFTHASIRVLARIFGDPGAVAGIFTYHDDENESDIELRTSDPIDRIRYSNQPTTTDNGDSIKGATFNESISSTGGYTSWNVYRLDWLDDASVWYVNGVQKSTSTVNVPTKESMFILNMWSNSGAWSGSMAEGGSARMEVQWVEMAFNTSLSNTTSNSIGGKSVICSIEKTLGTPVLSLGSTAWNGRKYWISCLEIAVVFAVLY